MLQSLKWVVDVYYLDSIYIVFECIVRYVPIGTMFQEKTAQNVRVSIIKIIIISFRYISDLKLFYIPNANIKKKSLTGR